MKNTNVKRIASVLISLVLCMVFTLSMTVQADAVSRTKTYQVVTQEKSVYKENGGAPDKNVDSCSYNKNGLRTETKRGGQMAGKTTYKRNGKGYITEVRYYNKKGKLVFREVYKRKSNGNITTATYYSVSGKKEQKQSTRTYKYWSRGKIKQISAKGKDYSNVEKFDKKGCSISYSNTSRSGKDKSTDKCTSVNKYDEKGNLVERTENWTYVDQGKTSEYKEVYTYKYTYNKKGNPSKKVCKRVMYNGKVKEGYSTNTITYKYKNVKVPEKYWSIYKYNLDNVG